jgi:hypothetical protein
MRRSEKYGKNKREHWLQLHVGGRVMTFLFNHTHLGPDQNHCSWCSEWAVEKKRTINNIVENL